MACRSVNGYKGGLQALARIENPDMTGQSLEKTKNAE